MERPKVALDLDETVVDFLPSFLEWYNDVNGTNFSAGEFKSYRWWETLKCSKGEAYDSAREYIESRKALYETDPLYGILEIKINPEAECILMMLGKYVDFYGVTNRSLDLAEDTFETSSLLYSEELEKRGREGLILPNDRIFYTRDETGRRVRTKSEICQDLGISTIIDDDSDEADECSKKGIRVFIPARPWNEVHPQNDLIFRGSWKEIGKIIRRELKLTIS